MIANPKINNSVLIIQKNYDVLQYYYGSLPPVLSLKTLVLPLERSVLRLNKLEGWRLKSERDPSEREVADDDRSDADGLRSRFKSGSTRAVGSILSLSTTMTSLCGGRTLEGDGVPVVSVVFNLLSCLSESRWGVFSVGVELRLDGGGVAGSWRRGATTAEHFPSIKPTFSSSFGLLPELRWPSIKTRTKHSIIRNVELKKIINPKPLLELLNLLVTFLFPLPSGVLQTLVSPLSGSAC